MGGLVSSGPLSAFEAVGYAHACGTLVERLTGGYLCSA
jgi:hypothetical protein